MALLRAPRPPTTFSAVLHRDGRVAVRGSGGCEVDVDREPALAAGLVWMSRAETSSVTFLSTKRPTGAVHRVTVQLDAELPTSRHFSVEIEALDKLPYDLTVRQLEILTLVVAGLKNSEIADQLTISARTVTTHVDRLLAKMAVTSRTAAATIALDEGLVLVPGPRGVEAFERLSLGRVFHDDARSTAAATAPSPRRLVRRPLKVGAALPLLGETAQDGLEMLRGAQLAVDEVNSRGGINMRPVELVVAELDHWDESTIRPAFDALAADEVDALTSGYLARQDLAHELAADFARPYLNAATLSEMVRRVEEEPRYGRIFQVCPGDAHYAPRFVGFLSELRTRGAFRFSSSTLMVMVAEWPLADLGLESAAVLAERLGWDLETFPLGRSPAQWVAAAEKVRATAPAAVLIGDYFVSATAGFVLSLLEDPPPTLLYSLYAPSVPEFRARIGDRADGLLWATVSGTYSDAPALRFAERFRATYGTAPGRSHAGISYDRVNLLASAWSRVPDPHDFAAVAAELRSGVHRGVNGSYWLGGPDQAALSYPDATLDPSLGQAHLIYQLQGGRHRIVSPSPYSEAEFVPPAWFRQPLSTG